MACWGRAGMAGLGAAAFLVLAPPIEGQECRRYALSGVRPGEAAREVRGRLGSPNGPSVRLSDASGTFGRDAFERDGRRIEVTYDALPDRREATVAHVRAPLAEGELQAVAAAFGPATSGRLEELAKRPVIWIDPACEIVVTATRQEGRWWDERAGGTYLEIETWASARRRPGSPASNAIAASERARTPPPILVAVVTVPGEESGGGTPNPVTQPPSGPARSESAPRTEPETGTATPPPEVPPTPSLETTGSRGGAAPPLETAIEAAEPPPDQEPVTVTAEGVYLAPSRIAASYVAPRYPSLLRGARPIARVLLSLTIGETGSVLAADVVDVNPRGRGFEREAVAAARQWRYEPGTLDGRPVESRVEVEIEFR